jgi:ABC-type nitrate/sulfonate/bicarbonate transport system substrate-binding protein
VLLKSFGPRARRACLAGGLATALAMVGIAAYGAAPGAAKTSPSTKLPKCSGLTNVNIGYVPSLTVLPMLVGNKLGIFKQYCLNVTTTLIPTPPNSYPELLSGQVDVLDGSALVTATFAGNGAPVNIIGGLGVESTNAKNNWWQVTTLKSNTTVTSLQSLASSGGTMAVAQLNSFTTLGVQEALARAGLSRNAIKFVVIPQQNQLAALEAGEVQAMYQGSPYLTQSEQIAPLKVIYNAAPVLDLPVDAFTGTTSYEASHPQVITALHKVIPVIYAAVLSHEKLARRLAAQALGLTAATAKSMPLPPYVKTFPTAAFDKAEQQELVMGYIKAIAPNSSVLDLGS